MNKYNIGDKVKIVNYGHLIFRGKQPIDISNEIVGKTGIVDGIMGATYSIHGIPEKCAWYNEDQLELIQSNPNTL